MRGKTSTNQEIVKVILKAQGEDKDILVFVFADEELEVNLNSAQCQLDLKKIFVHLLEELVEMDIELVFSKEDGYTRNFYVEACDEYVKDLNREIDSMKEMIRNELAASA